MYFASDIFYYFVISLTLSPTASPASFTAFVAPSVTSSITSPTLSPIFSAAFESFDGEADGDEVLLSLPHADKIIVAKTVTNINFNPFIAFKPFCQQI